MGYGRYAVGRTVLYDRMKEFLALYTFNYMRKRGVKPPILEIGVGRGEMQQLFSKVGKTYGQDIMKQCLECSENPVPVPLPEIPFADHYFGTVFSAHVLEHLPSRDVVIESMNSIYRVLNDNGRAYIIVPDYQSWKQDFWDVDYTHAVPFTVRRMRQIADDTGFKIIHQSVICGPCLGIAAHILHAVNHALPWRSLHLRLRRAGYTLNRDLIFTLEKL